MFLDGGRAQIAVEKKQVQENQHSVEKDEGLAGCTVKYGLGWVIDNP